MELISKTAVIRENVTIGKGVIIHDFVVIYPETIIGDNVEIFEGCVVGKPPAVSKAIAREIAADLGPTVIGQNSILSPHVVLFKGVKVGEDTLLGDNASVREQCVIGDKCIISRNVSVNYNTRIGNRVKIMDNSHITGNMVIEDDVFISALVVTTNDNLIGKGDWRSGMFGPHIKTGAQIGAGANLLPSVEIGEYAVVGAGSVVTKSVPANKLVMGIPARVVRDVKGAE